MHSSSKISSSPTGSLSAAQLGSYPWPFHPPPKDGHAQFYSLIQSCQSKDTNSLTSTTSAAFLRTDEGRLKKYSESPAVTSFGTSVNDFVTPPKLLSPTRITALQDTFGPFDEAHRQYLEHSLLTNEISSTIRSLVTTHPTPLTETELDTAKDMELQWKLGEAEHLLLLDGIDQQQVSEELLTRLQQYRTQSTTKSINSPSSTASPLIATASSSSASSTSSSSPSSLIDPTLFGLNWSTLSDSFRPRSTLIPTVASGTIGTRANAIGQIHAHSFANPSRSSLQSSYHQLLIPELENRLEERINSLWNEFDPDGEERRILEEEDQLLKSESLSSSSSSSSTHHPHPIDSISSLGPLDTTDLVSSIRHRIARLRQTRRQIESIEEELIRSECALQQTIVNNLRLTAELLTTRLQRADMSTKIDLTWLSHKSSVLGRKAEKLQMEVLKDTYLGYGNMKSPQPPVDHSLILPSLEIIHNALLALKENETNELHRKQNQVDTYQRMGSSFYQLAQEFAAINRQIANKKWTIQELHAHDERSN